MPNFSILCTLQKSLLCFHSQNRNPTCFSLFSTSCLFSLLRISPLFLCQVETSNHWTDTPLRRPASPTPKTMPPSFSSSTNAGLPMYKNHLQEYAQRSGMQIPCYNTANEGFAHAPKFRSTVSIDGKTFTSPQTFSTRKQAEQAAAKIALGSIERNTKEQAHPIIHQDPVIWKSVLHEFAAKTNKDIPRYTTVTISDDKRPVFVSTIVFDGKSSTGDVGKSKKEAEQLVARAAVNSLESGSRNILNQIIQSKGKRYAGLTKIGNCSLSQSTRCIEDLSKHRNPISPSSVKFNHTGLIGNSSDGRKRKFEDQNSAGRRIVVMGRQS